MINLRRHLSSFYITLNNVVYFCQQQFFQKYVYIARDAIYLFVYYISVARCSKALNLSHELSYFLILVSLCESNTYRAKLKSLFLNEDTICVRPMNLPRTSEQGALFLFWCLCNNVLFDYYCLSLCSNSVQRCHYVCTMNCRTYKIGL